MAKYTSSGLIHSIKGPLGDAVFSHWKGKPTISKRVRKLKRSSTSSQKRMMEIFTQLCSEWKKMSFRELVLWNEFTKKYTHLGNRKRNGLIPRIGNSTMTGVNAYISINTLLMRCGFPPIKKPLLGNIPKPPLPSTDLLDFGIYQHKIKFNVWLPYDYITQSVAQVWIRKLGADSHPYLTTIVSISSSPTQLVIDKVRVKENHSIVEKPLKDIEYCKLLLQLRTVAKNGLSSMPSQIYKVEVK